MPRPRWYDNPVVWLSIQIGEWLVLRWLLLRLLPDDLSGTAITAIVIGSLVVVVVANYLWLRHLRTRDEAG
jgi:hypothetical protein